MVRIQQVCGGGGGALAGERGRGLQASLPFLKPKRTKFSSLAFAFLAVGRERERGGRGGGGRGQRKRERERERERE